MYRMTFPFTTTKKRYQFDVEYELEIMVRFQAKKRGVLFKELIRLFGVRDTNTLWAKMRKKEFTESFTAKALKRFSIQSIDEGMKIEFYPDYLILVSVLKLGSQDEFVKVSGITPSRFRYLFNNYFQPITSKEELAFEKAFIVLLERGEKK